MSSKKPMNSTGMVPLNESNICSQYSPERWQNSKPIRKLATERIPEIIQETKRLSVKRNASTRPPGHARFQYCTICFETKHRNEESEERKISIFGEWLFTTRVILSRTISFKLVIFYLPIILRTTNTVWKTYSVVTLKASCLYFVQLEFQFLKYRSERRENDRANSAIQKKMAPRVAFWLDRLVGPKFTLFVWLVWEFDGKQFP